MDGMPGGLIEKNRKGYLFQDRFKSILCQDMEYAKQLIRYIHLNPLRAGIVTSLEDLAAYRWCGHAHMLGKSNARGSIFQDRNESLRRFGTNPKDAKVSYLAFLSEGIDENSLETAGQLVESDQVEVSGAEKGWPAVIGDPEFARQAMERHRISAYRKHRQTDYNVVLKNMTSEICTEYSLHRDDLFKRGRANRRSAIRALFCYRAHVQEIIPQAVIARFLNINIAPVCNLIRRGETLEKELK